ncbi:MAG: hypothetical protein HOO67_06335 [Candidatus Peribacteraceae bacterium]|nr:hypothetical protein [Candidatus Peribacteraceae bacterium]
MKKLMVGLLALALLVAPAGGARAEDSKEEVDAALHTLLVAGVPVYLAAVSGQAGAAAFQELTAFWFVPYGILVGSYIEWTTDPERTGRGYDYHGQEWDGSEDRKWEDRPVAEGQRRSRWKWKKAYPTKGMLVKAKPTGTRKFEVRGQGGLIERIGS